MICHSHLTVEMSPTPLETQQDRVTFLFDLKWSKVYEEKVVGNKKGKGMGELLHLSGTEGEFTADMVQEETGNYSCKGSILSVTNELQHTQKYRLF